MQLFPECNLPAQQPSAVMLKPRKRVSSDRQFNGMQKIRMPAPSLPSQVVQNHPVSSAPFPSRMYPPRSGVKRAISDRATVRYCIDAWIMKQKYSSNSDALSQCE